MRLVITDYKTGTPPNDAKVNVATSRRSCRSKRPSRRDDAGFANVPQLPVTALRYIRASGGEPPGEEHRRQDR